VQCLRPVADDLDIETLLGQAAFDHPGEMRLIFDHEYPHGSSMTDRNLTRAEFFGVERCADGDRRAVG